MTTSNKDREAFEALFLDVMERPYNPADAKCGDILLCNFYLAACAEKDKVIAELVATCEGAVRYLRAMAAEHGNPDIAGDTMVADDIEKIIKKHKAQGE